MGVLDEAIREHLELKRRHGAAEEELRREEADALGPARRSAPRQDPMGGPEDGAGDVSPEPDSSGEPATSAPDAPWDRELDWVDSPRTRGRESPDREADEEESSPAAADETFVLGADEPLQEEPPSDREELPSGLDEPPSHREDASAVPDTSLAPPDEPLSGPGTLPRDAGVEDHSPQPEPTLSPDDSDDGATVSMPTPDFGELGDEEDARPEPRDEEDVRPEPPHHDEHEDEGEDESPASDADDVLEETPDFLQETPEHDRLWFEQKPPRDFDFDE